MTTDPPMTPTPIHQMADNKSVHTESRVARHFEIKFVRRGPVTSNVMPAMVTQTVNPIGSYYSAEAMPTSVTKRNLLTPLEFILADPWAFRRLRYFCGSLSRNL